MHRKNLKVGQFIGSGHQIVSQRPREILSGLVVNHLFKQGAGQAHGNRTMLLPLHDHRAEYRTAVFRHQIADKPDRPGGDIHFHFTQMRRVGIGHGRWFVSLVELQAGAHPGGQGQRVKIRGARDIGQPHAGCRPFAVRHPLNAPIAQAQPLTVFQAQQPGADRQHLDTRLPGTQIQRTASRRATACASAAHAIRGDVGMPEIQVNLLRHDAKALSHGMGQRGFIPLPGRTKTHRCIHRA